MKTTLLFALVLSACGKPAQQPPQQQPATQPATSMTQKPRSKGSVITEKFNSPALGVDKDVRIYLPGGYDPLDGRRYPVFYYLNGLGGDETNWVELAKLDEAADALGLEAIVVMPDGDNNFYADSARVEDYDACMKDGTGMFIPTQPRRKTCVKASKYETYIVKDLVGWVDGKYKTITGREGRGIGGLSMGGYGALTLAMRHPTLFSAAVSHSGVDALLYKGPYPYEKGKVDLYTETSQWGGGVPKFGEWIRSIFGADIAFWRERDPAVLATRLSPGTLKIYLDCGTEDIFALHNGMQYLHDLLLEKKIDHEYYIGPGAHDFAFWTARLPKSLAFMQKSLAQAQ
jgi:putative tributyrin esterase